MKSISTIPCVIGSESENNLSVAQLQQILSQHSLPHFIFNGNIYGVVPYLDSNTLEQGFDVTDITHFTQTEIRNYLGY